MQSLEAALMRYGSSVHKGVSTGSQQNKNDIRDSNKGYWDMLFWY